MDDASRYRTLEDPSLYPDSSPRNTSRTVGKRLGGHVESISEALAKFEAWESSVGKLVRRTPKESSRQLAGVTQAVSAEVKMLRELRIKIENQIDDDSGWGARTSTNHDPEDVITPDRPGIPNRSRSEPRSTGELKPARWGAIPMRIELAHPAIYVLVGQIGSTECDEPELATNVSAELPTSRYELPECVIVKSMRLLTYLDFNMHDGSLSWSEDHDENVHFFVLRPFKLFVFFDHEIRRGLVELEEHRRSVRPNMTGQDYDAEWESNPPTDGYIAGRKIEASTLTMPELTGLIKDLCALVKFMDHFITPVMSKRYTETDTVYYSELWYTFPAGSLIYIKHKNVPQKMWRVIQRTGGKPDLEPSRRYRYNDDGQQDSRNTGLSQFVIDCYHLDFDGSRYLPIFRRISIKRFDGVELITALPVFPLEAAEAGGYIDVDAMLQRGQDFIECTRPTHRDYTGRNELQQPNGKDMADRDTLLPENASRHSEWIDSEVMVDMERAIHAVPAWRPTTSEFRAFQNEVNYEIFEHVDLDSVWDKKSTGRFINRETVKWQKMDRDHPPTEREDLLLLPGRVFAFVFRTRKWGKSNHLHSSI